MKRQLAVLATLLVLSAGAVGGLLAARLSSSPTSADQPSQGPYRGSEPPEGIQAPDFTLRSYTGSTVRMSDLRGRVVLTTFVDSACTESCPIIVAAIGQAMRLLPPGIRRQLVALALTVQPPVDTPAHIRRFLRERHALGELDYLVGSVKQMRPVWKAYHVLPAIDTGDADIHSAGVRVFDRQGLWVSNLHVGVDLTPDNLVHDIRVALRARPGS